MNYTKQLEKAQELINKAMDMKEDVRSRITGELDALDHRMDLLKRILSTI